MIIFDIFNCLLLSILTLECFRVLQSCSYKPQRGYFKIFASKYFLLLSVTQIVSLVCHFLLPKWCVTICLALSVALSFVKKRKCPLKFTKRVTRMFVVNTIVLFCLCYFCVGVFFIIALPVLTVTSCIICLPLDVVIANYYLQKAVKKIQQSNITVIAITGSYGKTCVKDMLSALLCNSVAPKGSCNTPLGIAGFVNKTDLTYYKYLILEFGARNVGDIRQLCGLFCPSHGIVTGICEQHLSTFKTLGNIVKTKGELVELLPQSGVCVLNGSDKNVQQLAQLGVCKKILTNQNAICNQQMTLKGSTFDVKQGGDSFCVCLPQLSNYITSTFLMCFETCIALGQSPNITLQNCKKVTQTPHRMAVTHNGSFWIVDDAYNANIKGVESCCQTLSRLDNYKIALTQGIVEGGKRQSQLNEQCGAMLGEVFDVVIVIGKYAKDIYRGASNRSCKVAIAKNLKGGIKIMQQYVQADCIVLFQNDLPDVVSL